MTTLQEALKKAGLVGQTSQLTEEAIDAGIEAVKNNYGGTHYELKPLCTVVVDPAIAPKAEGFEGILKNYGRSIVSFYLVEYMKNEKGGRP